MRNTINLQAIVRSNAAAGHSGQKSTVKRSEMRLSKIALYSASFEFFVALSGHQAEYVYLDVTVEHLLAPIRPIKNLIMVCVA